MRVVFAGTTGLTKNVAIEKLVQKTLLDAGKPSDPNNIDSLKFVKHFDFERCMQDIVNLPLWSILSNANLVQQEKTWRDAFTGILQKISGGEPKHIFLSLHSTFFYNSRFFTLVDQDLMKQFNPDFFVTLIDDSYAVWKRIVDKTANNKDFLRSYLKLRDILSWRTVEVFD